MVAVNQRLKLIAADRKISPSMKAPGLLVGEHILLGGGPISSLLEVEQQVKIDKIFLVDIHLDYISDIGFLVDSCFGKRSTPFEVWAHPKVIELFKKHFFNNAVWPDFSAIPSKARPSLIFCEINPGQSLVWDDIEIHAHAGVDEKSLSFSVKAQNMHFLYAPEGQSVSELAAQKGEFDFALLSTQSQLQGLDAKKWAKQVYFFENTRQNELKKLSQELSPYLS